MDISVVIPVFNAEKYIQKAVDSVLQFPEVKEIIIIEDASPDNALEVCNKLANENPRIKLYQHPNGENRGAGASRNLGIEKATQEYIAFLDADDYYLPNRFDAEKELFENPEVDGVYGAIGVDYYTQKAKEQFFGVYGNKLDTIYNKSEPQDIFPGQMFLRGSFGLIHLDTLTIKAKKLKQLKKWFDESLRLHQDTEFTTRISFYLDLYSGITDKPIAMRGVHEENRITAVETKKINPAKTRVQLWKVLNDWAKSESNIPENYKTHINRMYQSYSIANQSFPKNYVEFFTLLFKDFELIKNGLYNVRYRDQLFPFLKKFL